MLQHPKLNARQDIFPASTAIFQELFTGCAGIKVNKVLHEIIPHIAKKATNNVIEGNLKRIVVDTNIQERDALQAEVPALFSKEFADHAPQIIE
ncbi:hypothetical protein Tco_1110542 [Tanacetum coccineum]|uniref:Uncharacterized protein n=1 Tax=Tanacetum coccineum TaxID=301880 RepID=A0ABQ5IJ42_9ASTR